MKPLHAPPGSMRGRFGRVNARSGRAAGIGAGPAWTGSRGRWSVRMSRGACPERGAGFLPARAAAGKQTQRRKVGAEDRRVPRLRDEASRLAKRQNVNQSRRQDRNERAPGSQIIASPASGRRRATRENGKTVDKSKLQDRNERAPGLQIIASPAFGRRRATRCACWLAGGRVDSYDGGRRAG